MRCLVCQDTELVEHIRDGITIDQCPRCKGTWLDAREIDKLLDLAEARCPEPRIAAPSDRSPRRDAELRRGQRKRKRTGAFAEMLEDVFDVYDWPSLSR